MEKVIKLGELFLKKGKSVNPAKFLEETFELYSIPAYDRGKPDILKGSEIGSSKKLLEPDDVIISRIVPHIRRCWVVEQKKDKRQIGSGEWIVFRSEKVYPKFLRFYLLSDLFNKQFMKTVKGVGGSLLRADPKQVANFPISLPPLPEQKRIAQILDQADQVQQLNQQLLEQYDALTQSLFLDMFGDPVRNPMGWEKVKLEICNLKIGSGATPKGGKSSYKSEGISFIRSMNIYDNYFKYKDLAFIDEKQAGKLRNVTVEKSDVLFNITGASVCRCTIVPNNILPARVNQHVAILRPDKEMLNSIFLCHLIISENCKKELLVISRKAGATREAITKELLQEYEIILPPLNLQNQFAQRIQQIEAQKAQAQATLAASQDLFNSLLQKAFKGELS